MAELIYIYFNVSLQLVEVSNNGKVRLDVTINDTWTVVTSLIPGAAYHVSLRGVTASGSGPLSKPLAFTMPVSEVHESIDTAAPSVPASDISNNTYLIIGIASGAFITFACLFIVIYCIYRKRQNNKCPQYFSKGNKYSLFVLMHFG